MPTSFAPRFWRGPRGGDRRFASPRLNEYDVRDQALLASASRLTSPMSVVKRSGCVDQCSLKTSQHVVLHLAVALQRLLGVDARRARLLELALDLRQALVERRRDGSGTARDR